MHNFSGSTCNMNCSVGMVTNAMFCRAMAQVLAVPGARRHGFDFKRSFSHDFGRITGIAVSKKNNVLLCDYIKNQLLLFDEEIT
jgi:hypothetical protein